MDNTTVLKTDTSVSDKEIINHAVDTLTDGGDQWVLWRYVENEEGEKPKKFPFTRYNKVAKANDPATWLSYSEVTNALNESDGAYDGIGLMFDGTVLGVDLDSCLDEGEITDPIVKAFVDAGNTYTDISPSGTGLHLYFKLTSPLKLSKNKRSGVELYTESRFFTFSKKLFKQNVVRTITPAEAEALLKILGYPWNAVAEAVNQVVSGNSTNLDLEIVKQKMFASQNGTEIKALYEGDTSTYGGDTSSADAALCQHLNYWTGGNREAMKTLWLDSGLAQRDKTQTIEDYVERTLNFALASSQGVTEPKLTVSETDTSSSIGEMNPYDIFSKIEMDLEDFLKLDGKTDWLVQDLMTKGSLNLIASPPAQGKTFLALNIALSVAYGNPVFGKFKVPKTTGVLIVNEEDTDTELSGRLQAMVPDKRDSDRIKLYCNSGMKVTKEWAEALIKLANKHSAGVVILDNLAAMSLANENDAQAVREVIDCFMLLVRKGITVILIHHDRKSQSGESGNSSSLDSVRGSGVIPAAVHGYLSIRGGKDGKFVVSQKKLKANSPKVKDFVVQMHNNVTSDNSFHFEFEYLGEHDPDLTASDGVEEQVIRLCQKHGEDFIFTRKTLVKNKVSNSVDDKTMITALKLMITKGLLESVPYGDLHNDKQELVQDEVKRKTALVYFPTSKLLKTKEEENDTEIPF